MEVSHATRKIVSTVVHERTGGTEVCLCGVVSVAVPSFVLTNVDTVLAYVDETGTAHETSKPVRPKTTKRLTHSFVIPPTTISTMRSISNKNFNK